MARILVTGGAGFIGSHLTQRLLSNEHSVVVVDNLDSYYPSVIKKRNLEKIGSSSQFKFIEGDITDFDLAKHIVQKENIEIIFHQMARPGVRYSIDNPLASHTHNVISTLNLLKASLESDIEYFVNASSSSVYGEPLSLPYDESHPTKPISPYGVSKLTAEHYTRCFYEIYGLPTVSLRYFTVYGPRMRPDLAIFSFLRKIISNKPPIIYGDGEQKRDFTYVEDIVQANLQALAIRPKGEIFNIGSGKTISINDIFRILLDITSSTLKPSYQERVIGDVSDTWANIEKAKKILDWTPKTEIADGLKAFADWYMHNKHFYDQLNF